MFTYAAEECSAWNQITFADGQKSCMTEYEFFNVPTINDLSETIIDNSSAGRSYVVIIKDLKSCPIRAGIFSKSGGSGTVNFSQNLQKGIGQCENLAIAGALKVGLNPKGCDCELLFENAARGGSAQIKLTKNEFEERSAQYLALLDPKLRIASFVGKPGSIMPVINAKPTEFASIAIQQQVKPTGDNPIKLQLDKQLIEKERIEKDRLEKDQKLLAEKLRLEQEKMAAQEKRAQIELAKKEEADRLQKLAEEKRIQLESVKQQQVEREQKLAEDKRLQAEREQRVAEEKRIQSELATKAQAEKEQKLVEERRVKAELAAKIQAEREQKDLAIKQQKEAELKAKVQLAAESSRQTSLGKRLALVIGNARYQQRPLDNAVNDANDISKALKASGFEVIDVRDANLSQMRTALRNFGDKLLNNDVGLVYYSGHGVEVKGRNYFIPVNADIRRSDEIADQSLDVGLVLDKMETAQKAVNILIVDACRDDPFGRSFRSGSRGLATMDAPQGTIIAFATSPGKVAADGDGRNSPYTKNLVMAMQEPNIPIEQVFKKVRRAVQQETKNQQTPWENTSLSGDFYFKVQ